MKKRLIVLSIILLAIMVLIISLVAFIALPWIGLAVGIEFSPDPPSPEIQYGEFPFHLEYEIDGKLVVVDDTIICTYDGIGSNEAQGKFIKWESHLASGSEHTYVTLLKLSDTEEIHYYTGSAEYYMGWLPEKGTGKYDDKSATLVKVNGYETSFKNLDEEELYEKYKIRIIKLEQAKPIIQKRTDKEE